MPAGHAVSVSVPLGATEPRPVMVSMHGAEIVRSGRVEGYRGETRVYPFILCPCGLPQGADKFAAPDCSAH
jgi:hypothetical protein